MSIASVVTGGYGNGTFLGTIPLVVTGGYGIGEPVEPPVLICTFAGLISNQIAAVNGLIVQETTAVAGEITDTLAIRGLISSQAEAVEGVIEDDITAVVGTIDC